MTTLYTRTFTFKDDMSDGEVVEYWHFIMEELSPAIERVQGIRSIRFYSGAGALRADLIAIFEMDDAAAYERMLVDPEVRKMIGRAYAAWDLKLAKQSFRREITPELIKALSGRA